MSSSRSDSVTKFVRSIVRSFVRSSPFCDSQDFFTLKPTMLSKLLTIVLGVIFCMWRALLKLWSCSLKLKFVTNYEVAAWIWRMLYSLKLQYEGEYWYRVEFTVKLWICSLKLKICFEVTIWSYSLKWKIDFEVVFCSWCLTLNLKLMSNVKVWSWSWCLKFKFEVEVWS